MDAQVVIVTADTLVGIGLLLSASRQSRHREAVVAVGCFLLLCAVVLAGLHWR